MATKATYTKTLPDPSQQRRSGTKKGGNPDYAPAQRRLVITGQVKNANHSSGRRAKTIYAVVYWVLLIGFAILLTVMGVAKVLDHERFAFQLSLAPGMQAMAPYVSWSIPVVQFILVAFYFVDRFRLAAFWATSMLILVFALYNGAMLLLVPSEQLPCTCAGFGGMSWTGQFSVNLALSAFATTGAWLGLKIKNHFYGSFQEACHDNN